MLLTQSKECVAHYAISDLAGNFGGHGTEFCFQFLYYCLPHSLYSSRVVTSF